jgi:hypothetical protein
MRALLRHVEHGRAIDIDIERMKFLRDQPGPGEGSLSPQIGIDLVESSIAAHRRHGAPMRRPQSLHTAAFLVDQHEHLVALDRILEGGNQRPDLLRRLTITCEKNEPTGAGGGKETPLGVAEDEPRTSRDEGFEVHDAG